MLVVLAREQEEGRRGVAPPRAWDSGAQSLWPGTSGFRDGRYWARTSDPQLVETAPRSRLLAGVSSFCPFCRSFTLHAPAAFAPVCARSSRLVVARGSAVAASTTRLQRLMNPQACFTTSSHSSRTRKTGGSPVHESPAGRCLVRQQVGVRLGVRARLRVPQFGSARCSVDLSSLQPVSAARWSLQPFRPDF